LIRSAFSVLISAKWKLKKQSQFVPYMMVVNPFGQGAYDRYPLCMAQQNKAKQSQFDAPFGSERGPGAEQPPTAANTI
jgi:hypothetical protein